ncbi:uncharacterized protein LOC129589740 [Paramacrobiotus metropolitanus]|uniref:uncharacterized protein LOC129589740 n=1 Tax=Paramacrobiotus metropolitanus TaxID=2943436 RepID=UPI002445782C|nr:uncharacterized protein LOC129589740 [Paramacrobiotus metropolitanus]
MSFLRPTLMLLAVAAVLVIQSGSTAGRTTTKRPNSKGKETFAQLLEKAKHDCKGEVAEKSLDELLRHAKQSFNAKELAKKVRHSDRAVTTALECLVKDGLAKEKHEYGRDVAFQAANDNVQVPRNAHAA